MESTCMPVIPPSLIRRKIPNNSIKCSTISSLIIILIIIEKSVFKTKKKECVMDT